MKIYNKIRKKMALIKNKNVNCDKYLVIGMATRQWFTQFEMLGEMSYNEKMDFELTCKN